MSADSHSAVRGARSLRLLHGGRLRAATLKYDIAMDDWLDLSTGIAPGAWPVPTPATSCWQRLPDDDDDLTEHARSYYGATYILPVAGTQAAIRALPRLRARCCVGVVGGSYAEHAAAWEIAGHNVRVIRHAEIDGMIEQLDVLVIVNPDNPSGHKTTTAQLVKWHGALAVRSGWLIVNEAFMDITPDASVAPLSDQAGLIVLRSLGKFFGLAGARVGFVCASTGFLDRLDVLLGPWTISGPARAIAAQALADRAWQAAQRDRLLNASRRLHALLVDNGLAPVGGCALFQYIPTQYAAVLFDNLARRGVLTRLFDDPPALRFGLPKDAAWTRLETALEESVQLLSEKEPAQ